jgi:hypothetical protein
MYAILYIVALIVTLIVFSVTRLRSKSKVVIIALIFGLFALMMTPRDGSSLDIVRYYNDLDLIRLFRENSNLSNTISYINNMGSNSIMGVDMGSTYGSVPMMVAIMYLCSFLANHWLLFMVGFVDILCSLTLINIVANQHGSKKPLLIGSFLFLSLFIFIAAISGIRTNLVGTIFSVVYYHLSDKLNGKRMLIFLVVSIVITLIHPFAMMLVGIALLVRLFQRSKYSTLVIGTVMLGFSIFQSYILSFISKLSFIPFFASISYKGTQYMGDTATIVAGSKMQIYRSLLRLVVFISIFVVSKYAVKDSKVPKEYRKLVGIFICFTIGSFTSQVIFSRSVTILLLLMIPYLSELAYWTVKNRYSYKLGTAILLILIFGFASVSLVDNLRAGVTYCYMSFL